jgi:hypothetical protein
MMFSSSREHFATWLGVAGGLLLLAAILGFFNAEYFGAAVSGGFGVALLGIAVLLMRSGQD